MIKSARIKFEKLKGETPKALLIQVDGVEHWIPKSMCRNFTTNQKLGGHVELPTFILNRILDIDINEIDDLPENIKPTYVVAKHEPARFEPVDNNTIERLKKQKNENILQTTYHVNITLDIRRNRINEPSERIFRKINC